MSLAELFLLAVGLSMDAFAVSVCKGLAVGRASLRQCGVVGLYFGGFQALMPLLGYFLGSAMAEYITSFDHWVVFLLLGFIGGRMVWESFSKKDAGDVPADGHLSPKSMFPLAVATSVDALAVGVSLAFLNVSIIPAVSFIGVVTFALSGIGMRVGSAVGAKFQSKAELFGGLILVLMGFKILLEHTGVL